MLIGNQDKISAIRNTHYENFKKAVMSGNIYGYNSQVIKQDYFNHKCDAPEFDADYIVNPFKYQYDLEMYIFLHYDELKERELEIGKKDNSFISDYGATGFDRNRHLINAMQVRWPTKIGANGERLGDFVITPWSEDFTKVVSKYHDIVMFGGAGQGKTYDALAFMCLIFDYFYATRSGSQCSFSTVSEDKIKKSTWPYLNKLYPVSKNRDKFSLYAGRAEKAPDYTFRRIDSDGKPITVGGQFNGVLLPKGSKDSRVIDKLTGSHDPISRCYLLDEGQATDSAPIDAYGNMYLHPKGEYSWFFMSGNYELPNDLLGLNAEPNVGWDNVNESTHIFEGTLKSPKQNLGRTTCIIHYNNELSPAVKDPKLAKLFPHLPNQEKREKLYKTSEAKKSYNYKRFWIGWKFEKESGEYRYIFSLQAINDYLANLSPEFEGHFFTVGSFDPAPASRDRNIFGTTDVGLNSNGKLIIAPSKIYYIAKEGSEVEYHRRTTDKIVFIVTDNHVERNAIIGDFTYRHDFIAQLADKGITLHPIIYNNSLPKKRQLNELTKEWEEPIPLETLKTFAGSFEKKVTHYAHEKILDRITLGAYLMRLYMEQGCLRGFNSSYLDTCLEHNGFEKEFLRRKFIINPRRSSHLLCIDMKDSFREDWGFSPDIQDMLFQTFYMLYVILKVNPFTNSLGLLARKTNTNKTVDKLQKLWQSQIKF